VSTPKVACTSLKLVIGHVCGEDMAAIRRIGIHARRGWKVVPTLHELSDDELSEITGDNGWHVFAVVRHPSQRLWSAWQQKLLFRVPAVLARTPPSLIPPVPRTTEDVVSSFQRFVAAMAEGQLNRLMRDPHFRMQQHVLAARRMPYTRVYTFGEMDQVMTDLEERLRTHGGGPLPVLPSSNSSPLKALRETFTDEVASAIRTVYGADFRRWFRGEPVVPPDAIDGREYPATLLEEARRRSEMNVARAKST
jgi:Sulfotransferase family